MGSSDPTYPLYAVASFLSAIMLLLVLTTSFVRQSFNLGVAFLCFWIFLENLVNGIDSIIWSDNTDMKLGVYCDIVSRLQMFCFVVKPACTLIITRRLYRIANLRSVESYHGRWDILSEWILGLVIPALAAGPFYYVVQTRRFDIVEGIGCINSQEPSILSILLLTNWIVTFPLLSVTVYYPRVAWVFFCHNRDINRFLRSNNSVTRANYFRVLALASIDIAVMLPVGIVDIAIFVILQGEEYGSIPFYPGWDKVHSNWEPLVYAYNGRKVHAYYSFTHWTSPLLSFIIFALFGLTPEARATYRRCTCAIARRFGWRSTGRTREIVTTELDSIEFGVPSTLDVNPMFVPSLNMSTLA
ncbi:fungal pheromone STE3G-protein-coupled receptor [Peniophora sp. CONT]|nr:fungal pheromone STE3G-protein-coupled receptor [Peniophora sp. CONT]